VRSCMRSLRRGFGGLRRGVGGWSEVGREGRGV